MKRIFSLLILTFLLFPIEEMFSHDLGLTKIRLRLAPMFTGQSSEVEVEGENPHNYSGTDGTLSISIKYKLTNEIVFSDELNVDVPVNSEPKFSTYPNLFTPMYPGLYTLRAEYYHDEDINPSNNVIEEDYEILESYKIGYEFNLYKLNFYAPFEWEDSEVGAVKIEYDEKEEDSYLNMWATTKYDFSPKWIVKNAIIPSFSENTFMIPFDLGVLDLEDNKYAYDTLFVFAYDSSSAFTVPFEFEFSDMDTFILEPIKYRVDPGLIVDTLRDLFNLDLSVPENPNVVVEDKTYRGCEIPNIDLDSTLYNPTTVPGYAGDENACAPASAANSLQWLEDKGHINTGQSVREKITELSGMMEREPREGTYSDKFIQGKLAYINKHKLKVSVKFQLEGEDEDIESTDEYDSKATNKGDGSYPDFDFIDKEMKDEEDVEVFVEWHRLIDGKDSTFGAHAVCLSGIASAGNGTKTLWWKDDWDQDSAGGTFESEWRWVDRGNDPPILVPTGENEGNWFAVPYAVISESPDETIQHNKKKSTFRRIIDGAGDFLGWLVSKVRSSEGAPPKMYNIVMRKDEQSPPHWLLQNFPYYDFPNGNHANSMINLALLGIAPEEDIQSLQAAIIYSDELYTSMPPAEEEMFATYDVLSSDYSHSSGSIDDSNPQITADLSYTPEITFTGSDYMVDNSNMDAIDMEIIDLNMPEMIAGSGPAASANIINWLNMVEDNIMIDKTHYNILALLADDMDKSEATGISREDFIMGTLNFIDLEQSKIALKFQGMWFGVDDIMSPVTEFAHKAINENMEANSAVEFEWIKNEIECTGTVAIELAWYDVDGRRRGDWFVVTGYIEHNGAQKLYIKYDGKEDADGGINQTLLTWQMRGETLPYIHEFSTDGELCVVESAVSFCYDESMEFTSVDESQQGFIVSIYPNPSNARTNIEIESENEEMVNISIIDIFGREIYTFRETKLNIGVNNFIWNSEYNNGTKVSSGIYFINIQHNGISSTKLIQLIK